MIAVAAWNIEPTKILMRRELAAVLDDRSRKARHSASARLNRAIVRLACWWL